MIDRETARQWKAEGRGVFVSSGRMFQLVEQPAPAELLGKGNLIPFGHVPNKMLKPKPLHYPIPAMGDHRLRWHGAFMIPEQTKAECY